MSISANSSESLDRIPKNNPGTNPKDTAKQNYNALRYGNDKGSINFGHIHKEGTVTSGVMLQSDNGNHSLSLDIDGPRKGWTSSISPGNFQIECGDLNQAAQDSLMINAKNGNICIIATNGKIRMEADDFEFVARGDNSQGNFKVVASESISFESKKFIVNAKSKFRIVSPGSGEIIANGVLTTYGSIIRGVTDACSKKDSKVGGRRFQQQNNQVN